MTLLRVVYWNNIPALHTVERFNAVAHRDNLRLEPWFCCLREREGPRRMGEVRGACHYRCWRLHA